MRFIDKIFQALKVMGLGQGPAQSWSLLDITPTNQLAVVNLQTSQRADSDFKIIMETLHYICTLTQTQTVDCCSVQIVLSTRNHIRATIHSKFAIKHFSELTSPQVDQSAT